MGGKRMTYGFEERLKFSKGARCECDHKTIFALLHGCIHVVDHDCKGDDGGVDYIALLRRGTSVMIDAKTRTKGCSKYWKYGEPELAIEKWSVMPDDSCPLGKAGWTLDESKETDMVLYTFDPSDSNVAFLFPFQSLRMAAVNMIQKWQSLYKVDTQTSHGFGKKWKSQAVLVPASVVIAAIERTYSKAL